MMAGYVYVLVNSSMPGLVKVGKTTRLPSERVAELSGATGVATPFVVAFEQYFLDCDDAEDFVHAELQRRGLRVSANREFFQAATNEVIRVILQAPGLADAGSASVTATSSESIAQNERRTEPWAEIFQRAEKCHLGTGDTIQDYQEALKLYADAARLGSPQAYQRLGDIYLYGYGMRSDRDKALEYYKEGAKREFYICYARMAAIYELQDHTDNAAKCWARFFRISGEGKDKFAASLLEYSSACARYLTFMQLRNLSEDFYDQLKREGNVVRRAIITSLVEGLGVAREGEPSESMEHRYSSALEWALKNLSEGVDLKSAYPGVVAFPSRWDAGADDPLSTSIMPSTGKFVSGIREIFSRPKTNVATLEARERDGAVENGLSTEQSCAPEVPSEQFFEIVSDPSFEKPIIVELWAPWCKACNEFGPHFYKLVKENSAELTIVRVNVVEHEWVMDWLWRTAITNAANIPALVVIRNGEPIIDADGVIDDQHLLRLLQVISEYEVGQSQDVQTATVE